MRFSLSFHGKRSIFLKRVSGSGPVLFWITIATSLRCFLADVDLCWCVAVGDDHRTLRGEPLVESRLLMAANGDLLVVVPGVGDLAGGFIPGYQIGKRVKYGKRAFGFSRMLVEVNILSFLFWFTPLVILITSNLPRACSGCKDWTIVSSFVIYMIFGLTLDFSRPLYLLIADSMLQLACSDVTNALDYLGSNLRYLGDNSEITRRSFVVCLVRL